jgi:hypothetical protein
MRTKALFLAAALSVAGIVATSAQVYSVNTVGYVNVVLQPGFNLIANPLQTDANTIADLLPAVDGMTVYKYVDGVGYQSANYLEVLGGWDDPSITLSPGEGAFVLLPQGGNVTVTFVGEVMETRNGQILQNPIPAGLSMKSSMVPQAGGLTALAFPVQDGDTVYKYAPGSGYITANYLEVLGGWDTGAEPTLEVGEAVFVNKAAGTSWDRDFNVSPQN